METVFKPSQRTGVLFHGLLAFASFTLAVLAGARAALSPVGQSPAIYLLLVIIFLALFIFLAHQIYTLLSMRYTLSSSALDLRWGFRHELIPLAAIDWIYPVSDFDTPLPLPKLRLPGLISGRMEIKGLGPTVFAAAEANNLILVSSGERHFVISPENAGAFMSAYESAKADPARQDLKPVSESFRSLWRELKQDNHARRLLLLGAASAVILWVAALALSSLYPTVTWATLEIVPGSRLLILAVLGSFFWILNSNLGIFLHMQGTTERVMIYLLWVVTVLANLILTAALVIMAV